MFFNMLDSICSQIRSNLPNVAIRTIQESYDYRYLGERCQGIIEFLQELPMSTVAIYGHKELDTVAAMLGCALLSRPFVFVDVANPVERLTRIIDESGAKVILSTRQVPPSCRIAMSPTSEIAGCPFRYAPQKGNESKDFYVAFTSGSTGIPKGVRISQANFCSFYQWYARLLKTYGGDGSYVNHAAFSFDMGMLDLWPAMALGKTVVLLDHELNPFPRTCIDFLSRNAIDSWCATPSVFQIMCTEHSFSEDVLGSLRLLIAAGEPPSRKLIKNLMERFPKASIFNGYGPTEATCMTHCYRIRPEDLVGDGPLPLGLTFSPMKSDIVDLNGNRLPAGVEGEVELSGPQISGGYLNTGSDRSAFGERDGTRYYRTGDRGVLDNEGGLKVLGRLDSQLKWRGNRVELAEIEAVVVQIRGVCDAAAVPIVVNDEIRDVVLFVQANSESQVDGNKIKEEMAKYLPRYMRPRSIHFLSQMPITVNGKIDRTSLSLKAEMFRTG